MGARPEAVNGGWGDFGAWSECTRSCGGGISFSERECNNPVPSNRGRFCIGERRKLKICNPGVCQIELSFKHALNQFIYIFFVISINFVLMINKMGPSHFFTQHDFVALPRKRSDFSSAAMYRTKLKTLERSVPFLDSKFSRK